MLNMNYKEFLELQTDITKNPQNHTLLEKMLSDFVVGDKSVYRWLDMVVGKAKDATDSDSMFNDW